MIARVAVVTVVTVLGLRAGAGDAPSLSPDGVSPKNGPGVGVARFERAAPEGVQMPEAGSWLARRLAEQPGIVVVGPERIGEVEHRPSEPRSWQGLRKRAGIDLLVTGRATQIGSRISLDAHVIRTDSGESLAVLVDESEGTEGLDPALTRMAARVAELARGQAQSPAGEQPAVSAAPSPSALDRAALRRGGPIEIRSEELEVLPEAGGRRILFQGRVRAQQQGIELRSERLEAVYPAGGEQPVRLEAMGRVVVEEASRDRRMMCDRAVYYRDEDRVVCEGDAQMTQGLDHVRGDSIEIDLSGERVRVRGGVELNVRGRQDARPDA